MTEAVVRRSDATRAAILVAARERFASDGYERATIRAIAADAGIDPSMVMRYYGNQEKLFAAAAEFDLQLPDAAAIPADQAGAVLADGTDLDRYEAVRRPIAAGVVALTDRMTRIATLRNRPLIGLRNTVLPIVGSVPAVRRGLAMNLSELSTIAREKTARGKVA